MVRTRGFCRRLGSPWRCAALAIALVVVFIETGASVAEAAKAKAKADAAEKPATVEQRLDRLEKMVLALTEEVQATREAQRENAPPVVLRTIPEAGDTSVDASLTEIKVTFNKDMQDGTWSWTSRSEDTYPELNGKPHYADPRTCVLPVRLAPGKTYVIGINSPKFQNFKDAKGRSSVPFLLVFKTKP